MAELGRPRSHTTSYQSAVARITLYHILYLVPSWHWNVVTQGRWNHCIDHTSYYSSFTVAMALSYIVSEIKRDISRTSRFFHIPFYRTTPPPLGKIGCKYFALFFRNRARSLSRRCSLNRFCCKSSVYSELKCVTNRQTYRQTEKRSQ